MNFFGYPIRALLRMSFSKGALVQYLFLKIQCF